jgi:hypothetical protein
MAEALTTVLLASFVLIIAGCSLALVLELVRVPWRRVPDRPDDDLTDRTAA